MINQSNIISIRAPSGVQYWRSHSTRTSTTTQWRCLCIKHWFSPRLWQLVSIAQTVSCYCIVRLHLSDPMTLSSLLNLYLRVCACRHLRRQWKDHPLLSIFPKKSSVSFALYLFIAKREEEYWILSSAKEDQKKINGSAFPLPFKVPDNGNPMFFTSLAWSPWFPVPFFAGCCC